MWRQDRKCGHSIYRKRLRNSSRERLRKEGDAALGLTARREELALETLIALRDEERRRTETAFTIVPRVNLVVQQLLHVLNRKQVLAVHGNDNRIPNLRNQHLHKNIVKVHSGNDWGNGPSVCT